MYSIHVFFVVDIYVLFVFDFILIVCCTHYIQLLMLMRVVSIHADTSMINEKQHGFLEYMGDYTTLLCTDFNEPLQLL